MATAMIYSVGLSGHRQVYCDALTDVLLELGFNVFLAVGLGEKSSMSRWKHIERYLDNPRVKVLDTYRVASDNGQFSVEQIAELQRNESVSVTFFPCGDELRREFTEIAGGQAPKLFGKNVAIFGWLDGWFPTDGPFSCGLSLRERARVIRDLLWKNNPVNRFYENVLRPGRVVDVAFVKDERAVQSKGYPFVWLPEIYRPFTWQDDDEEQTEYDQVIQPYKEFLAKQGDKEVLLYFGGASRYKGFDTLLRLATEDKTTLFVLCGMQNPHEVYDEDVDSLLSQLHSEGRYFETGRRLVGWRSVDYFINSVTYYVSTHRLYASSGTVLQALLAGKPVLTPNRGTLGYRTLTNHLGRVYNPSRKGDLFIQWKELQNDSGNEYSASISEYIQCFSRDRVKHAISGALGLTSS